MKVIKEKGYAKINLYLDVLSKYEDGYHQVSTLMQSVSLADDINMSLNDSSKIEISCDDGRIPSDERNIACRAAELFLQRINSTLGVKIEIVKRIPVSGGLGGGSADAAAVLRGLNELLGKPLTKNELLKLGASIGADVPFCIECGTVIADGRGDSFMHISDMPDCHIVIANGGEGISTPFAYRQLDGIYSDFEAGKHRQRSVELLVNAIENKDMKSLGESLYNVFEKAILPTRPVAAEIKNSMISSFPKGAMMSGSGPSVFGIFDDEELAQKAARTISQKGYFAVVCKPTKSLY